MSHFGQEKEKLKSLFKGLGRPTNRGIRKCFKCGTINGTRGNSCKNRACDVLFRQTDGASKKSSTDACKIDANIPGMQVYSVRQRDKGPDYRSFVSFPVKEGSEDETICEQQQELRKSAKCYKTACNKNRNNVPCCHIEAAQRCLQIAEPLYVKDGTSSVLNIPSDQQEILSTYLSETSVLAQRVSKTTFVVKCDVSLKNPLGLLHIMFFQNKKEEKIDKKFLCACKPFKGREGDIPNPSETGESSKLCVHYHACLLAFASDSNLAAEFGEFLIGHCPSTLLSQLHLVTLPQTIGTASLEGIDTNHISVEIMHENMSLLESIAAVDDVALHSVQGLEGVLSDQIIVANVDDTLSFADASALEGLDDGDSQVCQIFSSAQNTIQLASNPFTTTSCELETINLASPPVLTTTTITSNFAIQNIHRKRKQGSDDDDEREMITSSTGEIKNKRSDGRTLPSTTVTFSSSSSRNIFQDSHEQPPSNPLQKSVETPLPAIPDEFDIWLAGVNERLNAVMNYKFTGKPEPIVYYISSEIFERLRERITTGVKKKRLPNQTVIITRTDKPPAGTFTKHVWKLTNMHHILQIFQNQVIPLKISQYFIRSANGMYENWTPPNETDRKNQAIKPHLHSTYLKVGKNDPNSTECTPFVIEWIADILPQSKLGELTMSFEFGHHAPTPSRS